jgi:hypothetical protein
MFNLLITTIAGNTESVHTTQQLVPFTNMTDATRVYRDLQDQFGKSHVNEPGLVRARMTVTKLF